MEEYVGRHRAPDTPDEVYWELAAGYVATDPLVQDALQRLWEQETFEVGIADWLSRYVQVGCYNLSAEIGNRAIRLAMGHLALETS